MFYIVDVRSPYMEHHIGTAAFQEIIRDYIIDTSELTNDQYQTFKGILFALDLLKELIPNDMSRFVVRFSPDE